MYPLPGNVYHSSIFMDPTDSSHTSSLAATSMHTPWQDATVDCGPGHLVPEAPGAFETRANFDSYDFYPIFPQDCAMEGAWNMHTDQLVGHGFPFVTSDLGLNPDPIGEDALSLSNFPSLFPHPNHGCLWTEPETFDPCHFHMPELEAVTERAPLDVMNFGFDEQSIPRRHYEDAHSNSTYICQWHVNGSPCNAFIALGDNPKHSISQHLSKVHSLLPASGKSTQKCQWAGCTKELKQESIVRHILTVHLRVTTSCEACGTSFARQDSLQRHIKKSCGPCKEKR